MWRKKGLVNGGKSKTAEKIRITKNWKWRYERNFR